MKITAVIMAGGKGERFWPKSRVSRPKQFLSLSKDGVTMIQKTVQRILPLVNSEDIYIVTNACYTGLVGEQLPDIPQKNILAEPCGKNTAPCIALACAVIQKTHGDCVTIVLPSDHVIKHENIFVNTLKKAVETACEGENLVTIGITPSYPETGYGYIKFGAGHGDAYEVEQFAEKPDIKTAREYLDSGKYLWNSGMFVWKVSSVLKNIRKFLPDIYDGAIRIADSYGTQDFPEILEREYSQFESESIDFGIMEKAENIFTIPASFGWDDAGSWLAVERINETDSLGNCFDGQVIRVDTKRTTVCTGKRLIAVAGLRDMVIVDTDDVLLVCSKNSTQDVKQVLAQLKDLNRTDLI